jgi:CDP-6-deoxy-D-xylo-4-hexulose-3-dehydrase
MVEKSQDKFTMITFRVSLMRCAFFHEQATRHALSDFILSTKQFSMGEQCARFENAFSKKQTRNYSVLFSSGGSANLALLQALKNLNRLQDGDKIGFSAVTWSTNVAPVIQLGMTPIPIDCTPPTLNSMNVDLKQRLRETRLKAFFITNALGFAGDLAAIRKTCDQYGIILLEDNCEALGATLPFGRTGNFGLASTFSFFIAHHMSTIEGGCVCTDDPELDEMLRLVRANGWDRNLNPIQQARWRQKFNIQNEFEAKYTFYDIGGNTRPTEITGFLGLFQLPFLDDAIAIRRANYALWKSATQLNASLLVIQDDHLKAASPFALPVICKTPALRKQYLNRFVEAGVEVRPMIAGNITRQPFWRKYVSTEYQLRGADFLHDCSFYCGNYPDLTQDDMNIMLGCLTKV